MKSVRRTFRMQSALDVVFIVIGFIASVLTLVLLFRRNERFEFNIGGVWGIARLFLLAALVFGVVVGVGVGARAVYTYVTTPRPPAPPPVPSLSLDSNGYNCSIAEGGGSSFGANGLSLTIDNSGGADAWAYAISVTDKDPKGAVWASVPAGATGTVVAKGTVAILVTPAPNLCEDIKPHNSRTFRLTVAFTRTSATPTANPQRETRTVSATIDAYYPS
jgi:hypothetical protein